MTSLLAESFPLASPDGKLSAEIDVSKTIAFSIKFDGESVVENCEIAMDTSLGNFGSNSRLISSKASSVKKQIKTVWANNDKLLDNYNRLVLKFDGFFVEFRAYDDAFAYRFICDKNGEIVVNGETAKYPFNPDFNSYAQKVDSWRCAYEDVYRRIKLGDIHKHMNMVALPFVFDAGKFKVAILDSDVSMYPKMNLKFTKEGVMEGAYAPYPKTFEKSGPLLTPKDRENFIAKSPAKRSFPWRVILFARSDAQLVENPIQYKLASPSKIKDTSWIKTGTCVWDWWHGQCLYGVDFVAGQNMETHKYHIDFASKFGAPFYLLDAGWIDDDAIATAQPRVDIGELVEYAKQRNVKIILWSLIRPFYDRAQAEKILDRAKNWGAAGLKIDFIERDDQHAVDLFEEIAALAAERKLLVDFHGCAPSSGLHRTYPNVLNFEGVRGGENNKGGGINNMTPSHNVDLLFTRSLAGPMDYTPGAMRNLGKINVSTMPVRPFAQGTRAHQMAMYVCYFEPLKMLSDSPSEYLREPECAAFMARCPTTWDETRVLDGKIGEYVLMLRRSGKNWYIGAMSTDQKEIELNLDFLPRGEFEMESFSDGVNSNRIGYDYKREIKRVNASDKIKFKMSSAGGGFVAKITPKTSN